jgi:hypothetical protein
MAYYTDFAERNRENGVDNMRCAVILLLLSVLLLAAVTSAAESVPVGPPGEPSLRQLSGERYWYTLDFLVFKDLAEGHLQLTAEPVPGRYRAELVARTLGVASWLSGDRTQSYRSVMEADAAGRLRTVSYESSIRKRKWGQWSDRQKRYRFDYPAGKIYQEKGESGHFKPGLVLALPLVQPPVDILTGFYNLRIGAYGALNPGTHLKIPTFTAEGITEIEVEVLTGPERKAHRFFPETGTLLRVRVDPEVFNTGGADLYAWFDETGRPARGVVENVIGLGDVHGRLREEPKQP